MKEKTIYALGFFDGVHLGHAALLQECRRMADELGSKIGVVTFTSHPDTLVKGITPGLINTPEELFADSKQYLDIYVWGLPFVFYYNVATGVFSALGDSRTPFLFLAASSTSNIFLDIFCVTVLEMGVDGLAWATFSLCGTLGRYSAANS